MTENSRASTAPMMATRASKLHPLLYQLNQPGTRPVLIALAGDAVIAGLKFAAGYVSGSSAMISEGVHTIIDASTEIILLYGLILSRRRGNASHQLGFGREVFFWNFVVAILIFALGSGLALFGGIRQIANPIPIENDSVNFIVLGCSGLVEVVGLWTSFKATPRNKKNESLYRSLVRRRDPTSITVLVGSIVSV